MHKFLALSFSIIILLLAAHGASAKDPAQDQASMTMVQRLFEKVWNENDLEAAKEIIHKDYSSAENITFASMSGLTVLQADMKFYREKYSNLKFKIERMFTHADTVVSIWSASGVANHEEFVSRSGQKRKKELKAEGVSLTRIADGKIVENRLYWPRDPLFP